MYINVLTITPVLKVKLQFNINTYYKMFNAFANAYIYRK